MIKSWFNALPGPLAVRIVLAVVVVAVLLALLAVVFERAGDLLDNGGVISS